MADAVDLKSNVERREGSNPSARTFLRLDLAMNAKICDICGATYLAPVTYQQRVKDLKIKQIKFDWIRRLINRKQRHDLEKTYGIAFYKETSLICDNETCCTKDEIDICPGCSDKICEFIDTLAKENDGNHSVDSSDISDTDSIYNC